MPAPGGTTRKLLERALAPAQEAVALAVALELGLDVLALGIGRCRSTSTMTEWSITRSTGTSGLTCSGEPPSVVMPSRMAARSTTAGTPVKSCIRMRAGRNGTSRC